MLVLPKRTRVYSNASLCPASNISRQYIAYRNASVTTQPVHYPISTLARLLHVRHDRRGRGRSRSSGSSRAGGSDGQRGWIQLPRPGIRSLSSLAQVAGMRSSTVRLKRGTCAVRPSQQIARSLVNASPNVACRGTVSSSAPERHTAERFHDTPGNQMRRTVSSRLARQSVPRNCWILHDSARTYGGTS